MEFTLSENTIGADIQDINLINIIFYNQKSKHLNIYNNYFEFKEDNIPLFNSLLESVPKIIYGKKYIYQTSETFIINDEMNLLNNEDELNKVKLSSDELPYPCFIKHINNQKHKNTNITSYKKHTINNVDIDDQQFLIRTYNLEHNTVIPTKNVINETDCCIFLWNWTYMNFQIIIPLNNSTKCEYELNIFITEDNKIIKNKLKNINNILKKITKIISYLKNNKSDIILENV